MWAGNLGAPEGDAGLGDTLPDGAMLAPEEALVPWAVGCTLAGGPSCGALAGAAAAGKPRCMGAAPIALSVPARNSCWPTPGRSRFRTILGVISSTISVLVSLSLAAPNSLLSNGNSLSPGTPVLERRSSFWISPASTLVSPSRTRKVVLVLRV